MKKISVVVPCYNAARYLDKCITQLLHQTIGIEKIEIILVDDASTDEGETRALIEGYETRFPDTIMAVFLEQNLRQGGARNVGVSYASCELKREEVSVLARVTIDWFPDLSQNPYVLQESNWNRFLRTVLEKEIFEQGIDDTDLQEINAFLKRYV